MGKAFIYIDNSNLYVEGCHISAVEKKYQNVTNIIDAMNNHISDYEWRLDYKELYKTLQEIVIEPIEKIHLWGSLPPYEPFWQDIKNVGFQVTTYVKRAPNKSFRHEKKVDTAITHQITKDAYSGLINKDKDSIFLVAGDADYMPVVEDLCYNNYKLNIIFWNHAVQDIKMTASSFISLNPYFKRLTKK